MSEQLPEELTDMISDIESAERLELVEMFRLWADLIEIREKEIFLSKEMFANSKRIGI